MLAFGTIKQQVSINTEVLVEIASELRECKSDAAIYVSAMNDEEWDKLIECIAWILCQFNALPL
jgi:hypothetical protein